MAERSGLRGSPGQASSALIPTRKEERRRVIERLLADPVAGEDQTVRSPVPDRQRKHAAQSGDDLLPPSLPTVDDDLCVAAAAEAKACDFELPSCLGEIVDLAVV